MERKFGIIGNPVTRNIDKFPDIDPSRLLFHRHHPAPSWSRHSVICLPPQKERTPGVYYSFRKVIFINLRPFLFFSLLEDSL